MSDPQHWNDLRPEVQAFALLMEKKLRANDAEKGKEGWKGADPLHMIAVLEGEMQELEEAICDLDDEFHPDDDMAADVNLDKAIQAFTDESVDVANVAMMCIDILGTLSQGKAKKKTEPTFHPSILDCLPHWRKGEPGEAMDHDMKAVRRALAFCVDALSSK